MTVFNPELDPLGPGVSGLMFDDGAAGLFIPVIVSDSPGKGNVGKFLDALPKDRRVVFSLVVSPKLEGMLRRRGFVSAQEEFEGDIYDIYERTSSSSAT